MFFFRRKLRPNGSGDQSGTSGRSHSPGADLGPGAKESGAAAEASADRPAGPDASVLSEHAGENAVPDGGRGILRKPAELQPGEEPVLQAVGLTRTFGSGSEAVHALKGVDLLIPPGRVVALKGRSGSGKTTLLNLLGALDRPTKGSVYLLGEDITKLSDRRRNELRRLHLGFIFQSFALVSYMSAYENVEFGMRIAGIPAGDRRRRAEEVLEFVGLKARMNHRPHELSGGEQQRVAIARAIAHRPKLLLADEPTAELDSRMGLQVMKVFRDLAQREGMTIVLTTHDPAIMDIVDVVYALEDGRIAGNG